MTALAACLVRVFREALDARNLPEVDGARRTRDAVSPKARRC
jgi:hypothetical protein